MQNASIKLQLRWNMLDCGKAAQKVKNTLEGKVTNGRRGIQLHPNPSPFTRSCTFSHQKLLDWSNIHSFRLKSFPKFQSPHVQVAQSKMSLLIGPVKSHLILKSPCSDFSILTLLEDGSSGVKKLKDDYVLTTPFQAKKSKRHSVSLSAQRLQESRPSPCATSF